MSKIVVCEYPLLPCIDILMTIAENTNHKHYFMKSPLLALYVNILFPPTHPEM